MTVESELLNGEIAANILGREKGECININNMNVPMWFSDSVVRLPFFKSDSLQVGQLGLEANAYPANRSDRGSPPHHIGIYS